MIGQSMRHIILGLLLACGLCPPAWAGPFAFEGLGLEVPGGFLGQQAGRPAAGVSTASFVAFDNCGLQSTTLQLSVREAGAALPRLMQTASALPPAALEELLTGVEAPREGLIAERAEPIRLGGLRGIRIAWRARAEGGEVLGVSYALAVGSRLIALHAHELGTQPSGLMLEAMQAIEALRTERRLP
jgi:hypothetical protein